MLGAVPAVEGRRCSGNDVFKDGKYTTATIPVDCTELRLWRGNIGDSGAAAIAEALKSNAALTTLGPISGHLEKIKF